MIAGAAEHGVGGHIVIDPSDPEAVLTVQTPSEISFNKVSGQAHCRTEVICNNTDLFP